MTDKATTCFVLMMAVALILALTHRYWGPYVQAWGEWVDEPIIATADLRLQVLKQARCK